MAENWISKKFPQFEAHIRELVKQHRELEDEPLHLAISYVPQRDQQDIFLFEVIGGNDNISLDKELFETTFTSTPNFPMTIGQELHLILTNRREFEEALDEAWPSVREIVDAIRSKDCEVLHSDKSGKEILDRIRSQSVPAEGVARG